MGKKGDLIRDIPSIGVASHSGTALKGIIKKIGLRDINTK